MPMGTSMDREGTFHSELGEEERLQAGFEDEEEDSFDYAMEYEDRYHPFKSQVRMTNEERGFTGE